MNVGELLDEYGQRAQDLNCYDELRDILEHFSVLNQESQKFVLSVLSMKRVFDRPGRSLAQSGNGVTSD